MNSMEFNFPGVLFPAVIPASFRQGRRSVFVYRCAAFRFRFSDGNEGGIKNNTKKG
jgi:hypothetical protein